MYDEEADAPDSLSSIVMNSIFGRTVASGAHLGLYGHGTYHILVGESIRTIPHGAECSVIHVKDVTFEFRIFEPLHINGQ